jgi:tetratricopeptide (TPR) repeat protein
MLQAALLQPQFKEDSASASQIQLRLSSLYSQLGASLKLSGRYAEALDAIKQSLACLNALAPARHDDPAVQSNKSVALQKMGELYEVRGEPDLAFEAHETALQLSMKLAKDDPGSVQMQERLARNYARLGHVAWLLGRYDVAIASHRDQFVIRKRLADAEPASAVLQRDFGRAMRQLSLALYATDQNSAESPRLMDESIRVLQRLVAEKSKDLTMFEELAETLYARARIHEFDVQNRAQIVSDLTQSITLNRRVLLTEAGDSIARKQVLEAEGWLDWLKEHPSASTQPRGKVSASD